MVSHIVSAFFLLFLVGSAHAAELEQAQFAKVTETFNDMFNRGQYSAAIDYGERSVKLGSAVFGANSPEVTTLMNNLANCHMLAWQYPKAIEVLREALARIDASGAGNDPRAIRTLIILARAYADDDVQKGQEALERALRIGEAAYGKVDPRLGEILRESGNNALVSRSPLRARRFYERAVKVTENAPPEFADSKALALFEMGRYEMALANNRNAEKRFVEVLQVRAGQPSGDPMQLTTRSFLIELYDRMGEEAKATEHVQYLATLQPEEEFHDSKPLLQVVPEYPADVKRQEGQVIIGADIDEAGRVVNARVAESDLPTPFGDAAIKGVNRWRYKPMVIDGKFVRRDDVRIRVIFQLRKR